MITFCRLRPARTVNPAWVAVRRTEGDTVAEIVDPSADGIAAAVAGGLQPVAIGPSGADVAAWVVEPADGGALTRRGVPGWRLTIVDRGAVDRVAEALVATGAAFLRTGRSRVAGAAAVAAGTGTRVSVFVDTVEDAVAAVEAGAADLLLRDWATEDLGRLRDALGGLVERTAFPPGVPVDDLRESLSPALLAVSLDRLDARGAARPGTEWAPGKDVPPPFPEGRLSNAWPDRAWAAGEPLRDPRRLRRALAGPLQRALDGTPPTRDEVEALFGARGDEVEVIAAVADELRRRAVGDRVTYVVNRNINYTNQCTLRCGFCGFSRGPRALELRGAPYLLEIHEVARRAREAWELGATEVCLQGGIHPSFTGDFYAGVVEAVKEAAPDIHVHGFTPLEVWQGAATLGVGVPAFLARLRDAGLGTLPGTAAEILDDRVRRHLCPDKIRTDEWADVMLAAHRTGLRSTATIMFGHIDDPASWANHFEVVRAIQRQTGGFTEFVPLPFVHMGAPIYLEGRARPGPTWDEVVLMHAVARIAFDGLIPHVQASWVKLGFAGAAALLGAGCDDLGGTLMDENISRASGAAHGRMATAAEIEAAIRSAGRVPARRTTLYDLLESVE